MILKIEVHVRNDSYPNGGMNKLGRSLQYDITRAVNDKCEEVAASLKKIEFTNGKA